MKSAPDSARGFTRFDLVALLAVLGVLALLSPALLGSTRQHGQAAGCVDHLRRLTLGWLMYAADHREWVPPNPDDGNTVPGHNWAAGQAGRGGSAEFNPDLLADPRHSMLLAYLQGDATVFNCPADERRGLYRGSDPAKLGTVVPAARSIAMNHAVGTVCRGYPGGHSGAPSLKTHGPWLNNTHSHTRDQQFRTYGKLSDLTAPGPARTWVLMDEDADSLNDAVIAFGMVTAEWIDWPGTRHDVGATLSFADGRAEIRRWVDSRTPIIGGIVARRAVPGSEDYHWLRERTSAPLRP